MNKCYIGKIVVSTSCIREHILCSHDKDESSLSRRLSTLHNELERKNLFLRRVWEHFAEELITREEYLKIRDEYKAEIADF
jgi:hypothetical protein